MSGIKKTEMTDKTKACARSGSKRSAGECPVAKSPLRDPSILPEHRKKAAAILESGDPFAFLLDVFHRDHVGDHAVAACLLLSAVSSSVENARGLHVAISGTSGTGRTHACNAMLHLLPAAHRMEGPVSKNSLEFSGDMQPGTVLLFDGTTFPDDMRLLLKSATDNFREPAELRKLSRNRQLKILTTPERCVWWLSRMKTDGTDPIMNRLLIVPVDESGEQGQAVFDHLKAADAALMSAGVDPDVFVCRAIGECLRLRLPWVIIPFARRIHFPFSSNRRNLPMFLDLIKCHAALNFLQREGRLAVTLTGIARSPALTGYLPSCKWATDVRHESRAQAEIGRFIADIMRRDTLYLIGAGSTTAAVIRALGEESTLLGIDAVFDGDVVARDLNEEGILQLLDHYPRVQAVVSPIGAQGFVLGRGTQQFSPAVVERIGPEHFIIIATEAKLSRTPTLYLDTGNPLISARFSDSVQVICGYAMARRMPLMR